MNRQRLLRAHVVVCLLFEVELSCAEDDVPERADSITIERMDFRATVCIRLWKDSTTASSKKDESRYLSC